MEALQSIILIGMHILPNVTGSAWMLRNLAGTEIQLARALGLDQIDSTAANRKRECYNVDPVELEVGRRVWWHLASTEWYIISHIRQGSAGLTALGLCVLFQAFHGLADLICSILNR